MIIAAALLAAAVVGVHVLSGSPQPIAARLTASASSSSRTHITIREFGGFERSPILHYDRDMTKLLHLIVVDDGLQTFMHIHPVLDRTGTFKIALQFPHAGRWHLYADGMPHNFNRQVFRFDLSVPGRYTTAQGRATGGAMVDVGPYAVALGATTLRAGKNTMLGVHIARNGAPAHDLRPYLGARAHAVLIGPGFSYIHAHAMSGAMSSGAMPTTMSMSMPTANASQASPPPDDGCGNDDATGMSLVELPSTAHVAPDMAVMLRPARPGSYHLWVQFANRTHIYTAPFVIQVRA